MSLASQGLPEIILTPQGQVINVTTLIERVGAIPIILLQMLQLQSQVEQMQKLGQLQLLQLQQPQWQLMQSQLLNPQSDQLKLQQGIQPLSQPSGESPLLQQQQLQQLQQLQLQQQQLQQLQQAQQLQLQQLQQLQLQQSQNGAQSTLSSNNSTGTSIQSKNSSLIPSFNPSITVSPLLQQQQIQQLQLQQQLQQAQQLQLQQLQQLQQAQQYLSHQLQQVQQSMVVGEIPTSNNASSPFPADAVNSTTVRNNQSTTTGTVGSAQPLNQTTARG
jgi:hypothetical protein